MPRVFLNYRREDSGGIAGRLFDRLCDQLGRENVFRDLDTLVPGADFAKAIADHVALCDALIAVIGKDWLNARDSDGHRRLDHPDDFVKTEIREALARDKLVIPALVEGASMPKAADLPRDIAALAGRTAIEISDSRFAYDTERLIQAVLAHTDGAQDPRSRPAKQPPAASNEDAEALLDTANSAAQHVAVLHVAFMALCAYVLVIVFGTTDMNLLIGKGVKLPVMDGTVPIIGFFVFAPYLVVLVHFNLLLQLQLLSRKLYAFDAALPQEGRIGGLRDRLHISPYLPYTYYLVGRPDPIVWRLGIVVGITVLVLPLATLLVLQLRFLAYQDQAVTWAQRLAVWLDVALVIALWPVIMDRGGSWGDYLRRIGIRLRQRWRALWRRWRGRGRESEGAISTAAPMVRGMPGLLLVVALGVPLPLGLLADGEWWEEELLGANVVASVVYGRLRFLDLNEQVLLAKPAKPEVVAHLREGDPEEVEEALKQVEGVNLRHRSLRGASFVWALLSRADLRDAQLQGANLESAQLQRADLSGAQLQGANLWSAQLQRANLSKAQLQGAKLGYAKLQNANLGDAQLQGADLSGAQLQGAYLRVAQLQGANLWFAQLQGADLSEPQLQGANLRDAQLQGADLSGAQLQGADLQSAELYGANVENSRTALVDLRAARWTPLNAERLGEIREVLTPYREVLERIERASNAGLPPPILESCLIDSEVTPVLTCQRQWLPVEVETFRSELFPELEKLACQSSGIARGLIRQIDANDTTSGRFRLAGRFVTRLDNRECKGLSALPATDKDQIRKLAKGEEERRAQLRAGKPAEERLPAPTPPPTIAPATL